MIGHLSYHFQEISFIFYRNCCIHLAGDMEDISQCGDFVSSMIQILFSMENFSVLSKFNLNTTIGRSLFQEGRTFLNNFEYIFAKETFLNFIRKFDLICNISIYKKNTSDENP